MAVRVHRARRNPRATRPASRPESRPPPRYREERFCKECDKKLSQLNPGPLCFACQRKICPFCRKRPLGQEGDLACQFCLLEIQKEAPSEELGRRLARELQELPKIPRRSQEGEEK